MWQEKRSSVRHAIELPVKYRVLSEREQTAKLPLSETQVSKAKNISDTGLLFLSSEQFKVGMLLELTFPVKDKVFMMEGRVVHASRDAETRLFRTGIYFPNENHIFKLKLADQLYQIDQYRKTLSSQEGRIVSEEEAAQRWIDERSRDFAEFYK